MAACSNLLQEMELFKTEDFYVLLNSESSLWCSRKTGEIEARPGWELANCGDLECLGKFYGLVGKIEFQSGAESRLVLIKEVTEVGELPDGRVVMKIRSVVFLQPCGGEATAAELALKQCRKHRGGAAAHVSLFDVPQRAAFAKTWGTIKSATNTIKSTTQQAAALATYQVKGGGGGRREGKEREKFEKRIIEELSRVFTETDSFYFCCGSPGSPRCDLTSSLQRQTTQSSSVDDRFFWNKHMLKDVLELNSPLARAWVLPIIQGFVQIEQCNLEMDPPVLGIGKVESFTISLISRRSRYRAGTRYKRRGLDESGKCANYVETEQCVAMREHQVSFVQVRGSVPLFWSQPGYKYRPPPHIDKGEAETKIAFEKHVDEELERYGPLCIVNLVEQSGKEKVIWEAFTQQVLQYNSDRVTYAAFDFHEHCRGMRFENVGLLVSRLEEVVQEMGFFWRDKHGVICKQNGVFRVNCVDCLDRTNVVQTALAKAILEIQMSKLGLLPPDGAMPHSLRTTFQLLWANNGDIISKQYAGTNALKGDYTRTGERKFTGMMKDGMNSANRYYLSRFKDVYRQATIDIMQGHIVSDDLLNPDEETTDSTATAEHVKLLLEDCKKLLLPDSSLVLGAWGLVNADPITGDPTETEMDTVLILTRDSYYVADYDEEIDKVTKYQRVPLSDMTAVELGPLELSQAQTPLQLFNKAKSKQTTFHCLRFRYKIGEKSCYSHTFRSTNLRFFNNVAVVIKSEEEKNESLRAICDCVKVAMEVGEEGEVAWRVDEPLERIEHNTQFNFLHISPHLTRNVSESQLGNIKSVGSKALSNVTSTFSKIGSSLNPGRKSATSKAAPKQTFTVGGDQSSEEEEDVVCVVGGGQSSDAFLPNVGIVMSNTLIGSEGLDPSEIQIQTSETPEIRVEGSREERKVPKTLHVGHPSDLKVRTFSHSSGEVDVNEKREREGEGEGCGGAGAECLGKSASEKDLAVGGGITASQSENALKSLRTTASSVLASPSAVLSPLTKLAKGVQSLGANLDPRKLKSRPSPAAGPGPFPAAAPAAAPVSPETRRLLDLWESSACKSRLVAI